MPTPAAHLTSIDALRDFRVALREYELAIRDILDCLGVEVARGTDWVRHDRDQYWKGAFQQAEKQLATAQSELAISKMASLKNEHPSLLQEKKNVELATARLRHSENQIRAVKRWRHLVEHAAQEHHTKIARLVHYLDSEIPRALATLDRMIAALEQYTKRRPASDPPSPSPG